MTSNCVPCSWPRRFSVRTHMSKGSSSVIGRRCVIRLAMCTMPSSGNGKSDSVINAICWPNASTCGYVAGSSLPSRKPHTSLYAASCSRSTVIPLRTDLRCGSSLRFVPPGSNPPIAAFAYSDSMFGLDWISCRVIGSRSQQRLATHPHEVAVHGGRSGVGVEGDRFGDVTGQSTLLQAGHQPARLAGEQRHRRGHLGLDEAGCHGVDRAAVLGQPRRTVVDHADHARLAGAVVGLADVAGNTRDRGHADDAAVLVEHVPGEQFLV